MEHSADVTSNLDCASVCLAKLMTINEQFNDAVDLLFELGFANASKAS